LNLILKIIKIFPPEASHLIALNALNILHKLKLLRLLTKKYKNDEHIFGGITFSNRLGTAAGLDKNGDFIDCLGALGFGFNNKGVDHLVKKLKSRKYKGVVGVNIGANKSSDGQQRINDYILCFNKVAQYSDYVTINISSPNTPGLRNLHDDKNIKNLIESIENSARELNFNKPIFLKISPDEPLEVIKSIAEYIQKSILTGLIISNTTINKEALKNSIYEEFEGGLSGSPLMERSTSLLRVINQEYPELPIIGVGGVMSKEDFKKKLESGALLVQIYTGFIIKGPRIVSDILN
jgi:dihydroorotate dehydrogenase